MPGGKTEVASINAMQVDGRSCMFLRHSRHVYAPAGNQHSSCLYVPGERRKQWFTSANVQQQITGE